ncbi:hypothetical protein FH581_022740 (plasmid) [Leptospira weilii]|uniref:hypothetical protein n=1 Tax=Leptospira weilii TaxID=28184 RepID=UPI00201B8088|nr:hypothetical protein [Leptospira weilii]UPY81074.1 hypothetical protein FH581_022740 [Leptospira weilii]
MSKTSVYNLEIEETHTYYVGKDGVLVHNYDPSSVALAKMYARSLSDQKLLEGCNGNSVCKQQISNEINAGLELGFKGLDLPSNASEAMRKGYSDGLADLSEAQANVIGGTGFLGGGLLAGLPEMLIPIAVKFADKFPALGNLLGLSPNLSWTSWANYPKINMNGVEYAKIGDMLYTEHAVLRMMPQGLATGGRSISPNLVDYVLKSTRPTSVVVDGVTRQVYQLGSVQVVTEGNIVVTINPFRY